MCERVAQVAAETAFREPLGARGETGLRPRWNVAPGQVVAFVADGGGGRQFRAGRWGLIPTGWKKAEPPEHAFNARAESLLLRPMFKSLVATRRCVVPVDGWYEWRLGEPFHLRAKSRRPVALAGLWDGWTGPDGYTCSVTIVTTTARGEAAEIHKRMPVVLTGRALDAWLASGPLADLGLLDVDPPVLEAYAVARHVNAVGIEGPECVEPV